MRTWSLISSALLLGITATAAIPANISAEDGDATTKLYRSQCASCHGTDGKGQTTPGKRLGVKDWSDGKTLKELSDAQIAKIIREGVKGPDGKLKMKPYRNLTADQVTALTKYVRALGERK